VSAQPFRVAVVYAAPGVESIVAVDAAPGMTVADAVARSGIVERMALDLSGIAFAIYGQRVQGATPLADGDRVELTRALRADPQAVRHARSRNRARRTVR
jgi:putative ubiquitin-RnfH superfamily antitoxin RatB of RatAB toxin-antitoxin module